jgi:hypothetical protein
LAHSSISIDTTALAELSVRALAQNGKHFSSLFRCPQVADRKHLNYAGLRKEVDTGAQHSDMIVACALVRRREITINTPL